MTEINFTPVMITAEPRMNTPVKESTRERAERFLTIN